MIEPGSSRSIRTAAQVNGRFTVERSSGCALGQAASGGKRQCLFGAVLSTQRLMAPTRDGAAEAGLHGHEHFSAVLTAIEAGRAELVRLHKHGEIHDSVLHALETELDLQETAARRHTVGAG